MPPSLHGTRECSSTRKPRASRRAVARSVTSRFWNTPPDSATVSSPCRSRASTHPSSISAAIPLWNLAAMTGAGAPSVSSPVTVSTRLAPWIRNGGPSLIAARFHNGVAALIEDGCVLARERHGLDTVALSGGVFQNLLVTERAAARLEARGFRVLLHSRVPCNDGGISLGQAVVAGARDRNAGAGPVPGAPG